MTTIRVPAGTITIFSDLRCPFGHVAVHRLHEARTAAGLDGEVSFTHRAFPLEWFNGGRSRPGTDSEAVGVGRAEPAAGWQLWSAPDWTYPSSLPGMEAVHAAANQAPEAGEALHRGLRRAFWAQSRAIDQRDVILDVAGEVGVVDVDALSKHLDAGTFRAALSDDYAIAATDAVAMSPHLFLPDGTGVTNPGMSVRWEGEYASGFPIIESDEPEVYDWIVRSAAGA